MKKLLIVGNLAKDIIFGEEKFGGSAASIAINTSRLGLFTSILSVLGKDKFSNDYKKFLLENDIDLELVSDNLDILPECRVTSINNSITSSTWIDNNCHAEMDKLQIDPSKLNKFNVIHLVSCSQKLAKEIVDSTKATISYEPGPQLLVDKNFFDPYVASKSKFIFLNEEEFEVVKKHYSAELAKIFALYPEKVLIVTKGSQGSDIYYYKEAELIINHVDAILPSREIVDHTGAGDSYKAGFLHSYLSGKTLEDSAKFGALLGSYSVCQYGGILETSSIEEIKGIHE